MKTFLLDTNVLLHDPKSFQVFEDNEVIIPISVLDELDDAKNRFDEIGCNARTVTRVLDDLRSTGSLNKGVKLGKTFIRVELNHKDNIPDGLSLDKKDNRLISAALGLKKEGKEVIVVSKDINLRVKCDALGICAQDYKKDKITSNFQTIYNGVEFLEVDSFTINELFCNGFVYLDNLDPYQNQFFILKCGKQSAISCYKNDRFELYQPQESVWGIKPRNLEQKLALNILLDPKIKLVTLIGTAGVGKTLLACAAALHQVLEKKIYQRILVSRPIQPIGRDIGFLPGSVDEKLKPWLQSFYDNFEFLFNDFNTLNEYMYNGTIHIEPLTFIRGRSIPRSLMIVDEAQNSSIKEIKTIITRMGEDSKLILLGDIAQVDNYLLDFADNGLTHTAEKFKEYGISAHITLIKGERSELATLASKIL